MQSPVAVAAMKLIANTRLRQSEDGQDLLEYGLLCALIALFALGRRGDRRTNHPQRVLEVHCQQFLVAAFAALSRRRTGRDDDRHPDPPHPERVDCLDGGRRIRILRPRDSAVSRSRLRRSLSCSAWLLMMPGHLLGATGAGDVKLMAAVGAIVGPAVVVNAFLFTAIAGGVLALIVAAQRQRLAATLAGTARLIAAPVGARQEIRSATSASRFAYGPAIAVGSVLAALVG